MANSKPLGIDDESGFAFVKEVLKGDPTFAINFDRLQKHPVRGYIIFELLLCDESQSVNPISSHPNRYWHKNAQKFIALDRVKIDLNATLYLVNYAKIGTKHEDKVLVIKVLSVDNEKGIVEEQKKVFNRSDFSKWFRELNAECS